jgi:predicted P-loop ATPase
LYLDVQIEDLTAEFGEPTELNRREWNYGMAKAYRSQGLTVAPIDWAKKKWTYGSYKFDTDESLEQLLTGKFSDPKFSLGLAGGVASNGKHLVIYDVDVKGGKNGERTFEELLEYGGLTLTDITTLKQKSPSGGWHYFFWSNEPVTSTVISDSDGEGCIDVQARGKYVVAFPSPLYELVNIAPIQDLPDCLYPKASQAAPSFSKPSTTTAIRGIENADQSMHAVRRAMNETQNIVQLLVESGYQIKDIHSDGVTRLLFSGSSTGAAGVRVLPVRDGHPHQMVTTAHSDDPLQSIASDASNQAADYFTAWSLLSKGMNVKGDVDDWTKAIDLARIHLVGLGIEIDEPDRPAEANQPYLYTDKGMIASKVSNLMIMLGTNEFIKAFGKLEMDEFTGKQTCNRVEIYIDDLVIDVICWLEQRTVWQAFTKEKMTDSILRTCRKNSFDSYRGLVASLPVWDGNDRIRLWSDANTESPLADVYLKKWLMAGILRATSTNEMGHSFDSILILQGVQGVGKSRFLRHIAPQPSWFTDNINSGIISPNSKDELSKLRGKAVIEFSEMSAFSGRRFEDTNNNVKQFLSVTVDEYREAYARGSVKLPRRCVFAGTSNDNAFISDMTGSRRYMVVRLKDQKMSPEVEVNTLQWWAQAKYLVESGEIQYLTDDQEVIQKETNAEFQHRPDNYDVVIAWARTKSYFHINDIVGGITGLNQKEIDNGLANASVKRDIKQSLLAAGFKITNQGIRVYMNPDNNVRIQFRDAMKTTGERRWSPAINEKVRMLYAIK